MQANLSAEALAQVVVADFVMSMEPFPVATADHHTCVPVMGVDGFRDREGTPQRFSDLTESGIAASVLDSGLNITHKGIAHPGGQNFASPDTHPLKGI